MSLGQRLRLLDARYAPPGGPDTPGPGANPAWVVAAIVLGLVLVALLMAALTVDGELAFLLAPVGILFGFVAGRLYEVKAAAAGRGVTGRG